MNPLVVKALRWIPALFILACSWHLSSQSRIEEMPEFWNADKLVHLVCFGGFAFWVAFGLGVEMSSRKRFLLAVALISAYGVIDEIHQSMVPGRSCSALDWLADTVGALFGAFVFSMVARWWQSRKA